MFGEKLPCCLSIKAIIVFIPFKIEFPQKKQSRSQIGDSRNEHDDKIEVIANTQFFPRALQIFSKQSNMFYWHLFCSSQLQMTSE